MSPDTLFEYIFEAGPLAVLVLWWLYRNFID